MNKKNRLHFIEDGRIFYLHKNYSIPIIFPLVICFPACSR